MADDSNVRYERSALGKYRSLMPHSWKLMICMCVYKTVVCVEELSRQEEKNQTQLGQCCDRDKAVTFVLFTDESDSKAYI